MLICACAEGQVAQDITSRCRFRVSRNANDRERLWDDRYKTYWDGGKDSWIEFIAPENNLCYGLYVKWAQTLTSYRIEIPSSEKDGEWVPVTESIPVQYFQEYIPIGGLAHFRIHSDADAPSMCVTEVQVLGEGDLPDWVHIWRPFEGQADLMILSAHPDDEVLWFGGMIPYYRGELGYKVLVVNVSKQPASRKLELLDCLWTCGIREYPVLTGGNAFIDQYRNNVTETLKLWGEANLLQFVTGVIREYQPIVVATHDLNGEYGHGAHKTCAYAMQKCVDLAADPKYKVKGKESLDPWQIQKVYIHLYQNNQITMDWRIPLTSFGGKTAFDVACDGFKCHRTQNTGKYVMRDYGKYDSRLFGLYSTAVGPDIIGNDLFENTTLRHYVSKPVVIKE